MALRLSVKTKVTAWFTTLMLIVAAGSLYAVIALGGTLFETSSKERLFRAVNINAQYIKYRRDERKEQFELGQGFEHYSLGTYCLVYRDGQIISGALPDGFPDGLPLTEGAPILTVFEGRRFYLYDVRAANGMLWLRGIRPADGGEGLLLEDMTRFALLTLPILVLLGALGGFFIVKRAFRPIEKMIAAADAINEGRDLSARIGLPYKDDEIHKIAEAFDRMLARLERSFEAEKQFASDASHELRTPTSVILAQCEALKKEGLSKEDYENGLEAIDRQARRISRLVSLLLNITRFEQGTAKPRFERADFSELVAVVCEGLKSINPSAELRSEIEKEIFADIDVALMSRLIENLLENAVKYGGGAICVTLRRTGGRIELSVADNGSGISQEELPKIWQRFYRGDKSRSTGGVGLGLSLVKQIAELHKAEVTAESAPGKGSKFTLIMAEN